MPVARQNTELTSACGSMTSTGFWVLLERHSRDVMGLDGEMSPGTGKSTCVSSAPNTQGEAGRRVKKSERELAAWSGPARLVNPSLHATGEKKMVREKPLSVGDEVVMKKMPFRCDMVCQECPLMSGGKAMPPVLPSPSPRETEMLMVNDSKQWPICGGGRVLCTPP